MRMNLLSGNGAGCNCESGRLACTRQRCTFPIVESVDAEFTQSLPRGVTELMGPELSVVAVAFKLHQCSRPGESGSVLACMLNLRPRLHEQPARKFFRAIARISCRQVGPAATTRIMDARDNRLAASFDHRLSTAVVVDNYSA